MFYTSSSLYCSSGQRFASISVVALTIALLISHSHLSSAVADYDSDTGGDGSDLRPSGNGGGIEASDTINANDDIYETSVLQQDMDEHEKRQKQLNERDEEDVVQREQISNEKVHEKVMTPNLQPQQQQNDEISTESMNLIRSLMRSDDMIGDTLEEEEDEKEEEQGAEEQHDNAQINNVSAKIPLALPPTTNTNKMNTLIPAYVRGPKAEPFPRTITGGSVAVEEADANVSTSDYVDENEDEEHMLVNVHKTNKIDPIAMKFYHKADAKDNTLKEKQLMPLLEQTQQQQQQQHHHHEQQQSPVQPVTPQTTPNDQLHANNSEEDYYDDLQDTSFETQNFQHSHQQHHRLNDLQTTMAPPPLLPLTPLPRFSQSTSSSSSSLSSLSPLPLSTPSPSPRPQTFRIGVAMLPPTTTNDVNMARVQPIVVPQARGISEWNTTNSPFIPVSAIPTTQVIPFFDENSANPAATTIIPAAAAATFGEVPTSFNIESVAITTMLPATTTAPTSITPRPTPPPITTLRPTGKQGKQINLPRGRKLLAHEQLRNYIEDAYIRMPLAVIVDPSSDALDKTKALWREALRTNLNIKIVLVSLNASGIPAAYNFNNTRQFIAGLNSIKEHDGGNSFVGILHASELVPYDSAVFISTAAIPPHTELVQDAAITLLKKRIRLYLIWYGERSLSENETQEAVGGILGEVAIRSGGEVLHLVGSENSQELEGSTLTLVADAYVGTQEVDIPVDTTLSSLHVKIDAPMRTATLETPNGDINLKKLVKFKSHVLTNGPDDHRLDAYVPLNKLRKATVYKLKIVPECLSDEYGVFVRAERKSDLFLDDLIKHFDSFIMHSRGTYPLRLNDVRLNSLPDEYGKKSINTYQGSHSNLRFADSAEELDSENPTSDSASNHIPTDEVETFSDTEIVNNNQKVFTKNFTTSGSKAVVNINTNYNGMARALGATNALLQRDVTKIEMGLQSQLLLAPGMLGTLQFELTNTRTEGIYHNIQVVDEMRFLLRLNPQNIFLRAGEIATVSVTVLIPNSTPQGTIDKITFTCNGGGTSSLSLNLKVLSATSAIDGQDTTAPSVSWTFGSRCENINTESSSCTERFWTLDITAQDWQTGVLRLQTLPTIGLLYRNSYTIGSTESLKATYIATCCEPKVAITAFDVAGNQRSYNVDVRDLIFTEASIAAIVLGTLLLLLIIIILIWGIVWCCRRRQVSLDLPTYRSHSTRSME